MNKGRFSPEHRRRNAQSTLAVLTTDNDGMKALQRGFA
jgi:hypothetical protein